MVDLNQRLGIRSYRAIIVMQQAYCAECSFAFFFLLFPLRSFPLLLFVFSYSTINQQQHLSTTDDQSARMKQPYSMSICVHYCCLDLSVIQCEQLSISFLFGSFSSHVNFEHVLCSSNSGFFVRKTKRTINEHRNDQNLKDTHTHTHTT
jgi:hypothetical protein